MGKSSKRRCIRRVRRRNPPSFTRRRGRVNRRNYPFVLYRAEAMKRYVNRHRKQPGLSFQRQLSKKWLSSPRLRARYRLKAQRFWNRRQKELQLLNRRRAGRKRRRPRHIPRGPQPPFFLFCLKERPKVRRQHPKWSIKKVGVELGRRWRALPERVKEDYKRQSARNRRKHKAFLRKYYKKY